MKSKANHQIMKNLIASELIESIGEGISIQDSHFRVLYQNKIHKQLIGDHLGEYCFKAYEKRESICKECPVKLAFKDKNIHKAERTALTDQGIKYVEITASPIKNAKGEILAAIEIVKDITDQKQINTDLSDSEEKYRGLFSAVHDALIIVDPDYRQILDANEAASHLYGYSRDEILNLKGPDLSAEKNKSNAAIRDVSLSPEKHHFHFRNHKKKDGTIFPVEISSSTFMFKGRKLICAIIRDITERRMMEEILLKERDKAQKYLDIVEVAIIAINSNEKVTLINKKGCDVLGYKINEIMNKNWFDNFLPEWNRESVRKVFRKLLSGEIEPLEYFENPILTKSGTERIIAWHNAVIKDADNNIIGTLSSGADITEHRLIDQERENLNIELAKKNKELEQVLYVTSHDLRSPLVNIGGFSKELEYSLKELMGSISREEISSDLKDKIDAIVKKDIPESMKFIQSSINKMDILISGILKLSRTGRVELKIENIDMNKMIENMIKNFEFILTEAGIKVEFSQLPSCKGDEIQLNQLFSNLIDNAIKYLDQNRPGLIKISGLKKNAQSVYCIEDNGIGIPPQYQDKIFEIFHQLDPSKVSGEGLGLTIAHTIVELHKGKIWVESEQNKGSKFFVSINS